MRVLVSAALASLREKSRLCLFLGDPVAMGLRRWTGICRPSGA
jgi:hypothetical protein